MAFVAMDPKTGQILTMIGSRDYWDKERDGNYNATTPDFLRSRGLLVLSR